MSSHPWTDRLSEYVDEELDAAERAGLEVHLSECAACAAVVADLRRVVARARALPGEAPGVDLWPGIEARIAAHPRPIPIRRAPSWTERRFSFSVPQLAAACLAVVAVGALAVWYSGGTTARRDAGELIPGSTPASWTAAAPGSVSGPSSQSIEELRGILASGRDELDPATIRTLEESLTVIEIAIAQARRALEADPQNPYVRAHLDETMRRKVELLHRATMLASAPR